MTRKSLFWGCLFIILGGILTLANLGVETGELSEVLRYWPLVLIIAGASMLRLGQVYRMILSAMSGAFLGLLLAALALNIYHNAGTNFAFHFFEDRDDYAALVFVGDTSRIYADTNSRVCELNLRTALGKYVLSDSAAGLIDVVSPGGGLLGSHKISDEDNIKRIKLALDSKSYVFQDSPAGEPTRISLDSKREWHIDAKTGAADFSGDLSRLNVKSFNLKSAAANVDLRFGTISSKTDVRIKSGAASVKVEIPKEAACRLYSKTGLSDMTLDGFTSVGKNRWATENADTATCVFEIEIKGGASEFKILRY